MSDELFRIDRFDVPDPAFDEFLTSLQPTHDLLRELPGCGQNVLLEGPRENGSTRLLTLVTWTDDAAIAAAQRAVRRLHEATGFSPARTVARLGVTADLGLYRVRPWPQAR
ncbi:hypothetical protein [Pseudonocardia humida]|uniref:Antibiotic biosynthesis monooxygenase n=1 Tax=Pseudonocardia humida TaxID=2800819 RepID=A0ABT0ZSG4_9PSEU|nr:hypothetical protein [Pseudonocardia humida]MCO1653666.1 hypothetical protein [Pseudonocardia humida]